MDTTIRKAPEIRVDRGQPVIVTVTFVDGDPDEVNFNYLRPDDERPYVDDGYGQAKSRITRVGEGVYRYVISTQGFAAGKGVWHFSAKWHERRDGGHDAASIFGDYHVNAAPVQLV